MNKDEITQKLALLPEGLAESNIQSWNKMVEFFESPVDAMIGEHFPYSHLIGKIAYAFSMNEQAKLFRAGEQAYTLIISTADEQDLKIGEPCLSVSISNEFLIVRYKINEPNTAKERSNIKIKIMDFGEGEKMNLSQYNIMTALQPMLNLLWDETRGKKKAYRDRINFNL